jgi:hypothetical protein
MRARSSREPSAGPTTAPKVLSTARLGQLLDRSVRTIRRLDAAGKLPRAIRIGGRKCYRADEVRAWLAAGCPDCARWEMLQSGLREGKASRHAAARPTGPHG